MHFLDTLQAGLGHTVMIIVFFQVLIKLIKPYTRIKIGFISGELNIDPNDVESLLVSCILDNTIYGRIDQVRHFTESGEIIPRTFVGLSKRSLSSQSTVLSSHSYCCRQ